MMIRARWQGAWVIRSGEIRQREVWLVEGDELMIRGGAREGHYRFALVAPCKGSLSRDGAMGNMTHPFAFAFAGDQLYAGSSKAGVKRGNDIVACTLAGIYTHVEGRCFHREQHPLRAQEWKKTAFGPQRFRIAAGMLVHQLRELDQYLALRAPDIQAAEQAAGMRPPSGG